MSRWSPDPRKRAFEAQRHVAIITRPLRRALSLVDHGTPFNDAKATFLEAVEETRQLIRRDLGEAIPDDTLDHLTTSIERGELPTLRFAIGALERNVDYIARICAFSPNSPGAPKKMSARTKRCNNFIHLMNADRGYLRWDGYDKAIRTRVGAMAQQAWGASAVSNDAINYLYDAFMTLREEGVKIEQADEAIELLAIYARPHALDKWR